jgi:hypothetical protein
MLVLVLVLICVPAPTDGERELACRSEMSEPVASAETWVSLRKARLGPDEVLIRQAVVAEAGAEPAPARRRRP